MNTDTGAADAGSQNIRLESPDDLLAIIPDLLGFRPDDSVVIIGTEPPRDKITVTLRFDLPDPADTGAAAGIAAHSLDIITAQALSAVIVVGYGPGRQVTPVADAIRAAAARSGVRVLEMLRVEDDRWSSYLCPGTCHPAEVPVPDPGARPAGAELNPGGAVLASRAALADTLIPLGGRVAAQMTAETRRCERIAASYLAAAGAEPGSDAADQVISRHGSKTLCAVIRGYRDDQPVPEASTFAWLSVVLTSMPVQPARSPGCPSC